MPHVTSMERLGIKKGRAEGIDEGIAAIIEIKFGQAGLPLSERAYRSKEAEALQKLMERLKQVKSLPEAEKIFDEFAVPNPSNN